MASCIPQANGVPWISEAPQWWDNSGAPPRAFNADLNDVRWDWAVRREYQTGTGIDATFRGVYMTEGGRPYLYLQWHVPDDPSLDNKSDGIFVGFQRIGQGGPDGTAYVIEVDAYQVAGPNVPPGDFAAGGVAAMNMYQRQGSSWTQVPGALPTWLNDSTRAWFKTISTTNPQTYEWAVAMRVPVNNSGADLNGGATAAGGGLNLAGPSFRFFYAIVADHGQQTGVYPVYWPRNAQITLDASLQNDYGNPTTAWDTVQLGSGAGCGPGISLDPLDVGTTNTDPNTGLPAPNQIHVSLTNPPTNHLYAHPYNNTGSQIAANEIFATFRTANWGSQVPWTGQFAPGATPWEEIVDGNPPPNMRNNAAAFAQATKGEIAFDWTISTQQAADWVGPNAPKMTHQCMLVTLSAPGQNIDFVNDSVYRNMDFVKTSVVSKNFEISLEGLKKPRLRLPLLATTPVFVRVAVTNMPRALPPNAPMQPIPLKELFLPAKALEFEHAATFLPGLAEPGLLPRIGPIPEPEPRPGPLPRPLPPRPLPHPIPQRPTPPPTVNDMISHLTTVRYIAHYQSGRRLKIGGQIRPIMTPLTSFGFFVEAGHPVYGWDHALGGAFAKIGPNTYKVSVPTGGAKTLLTKLVGYDKVPPASRMPPIVAGPAGPIQSKIPILKTMPSIGSVLSGVIRR